MKRRSIISSLLFTTTAQAEHFYTNASVPAGLSVECSNSISQDIGCSLGLKNFEPGSYYSAETLEKTCTDGCRDALESYSSNVRAACSNETWAGFDDEPLPVAVIADLLRYNFDLACLMDSGHYCNNLAAQAAGWAGLQQPVQGSDPDTCDLCFIKNLQYQASSPFYAGPELGDVYASKTASCGVKNYPLSTVTLPYLTTTNEPTATNSPCSGTTYEIQSSDDCSSIASSQGIGTAWMLLDNKLPAFCKDFPTSGTLCLANKCDTHLLQMNDTCKSIASDAGITTTQLLSWNPSIDAGCDNLEKQLDTYICISKPGPAYDPPTTSFPAISSATSAAPMPTNAAQGSRTECGRWYDVYPGDYCNKVILKFGISLPDFLFLNPDVNSNCTNLYAHESYCVAPVGDISDYPDAPGYVAPISSDSGPVVAFSDLPTAGYMPTTTTTSSAVLPLATGTRSDCAVYINGNLTTNCGTITFLYGVSIEDFLTWNPSLGTDVNACTIPSEGRFCASLWDVDDTEPTSVVSIDVPKATQVCSHDFLLSRGCVANTFKSGITPKCSKFAILQKGDTCQSFVDGWTVSFDQFYEWNPAVKSDCSVLIPGKFELRQYCRPCHRLHILIKGNSYCVRAPGWVDTDPYDGSFSDTAAPSTTQPPAQTGVAPGPTQTGQPSDCNAWYVAQKGDDCSIAAAAGGITLDEFYVWNPAIGQDCSGGFWAGNAYCVNVSSRTTSKTTTSAPATTTAANSVPSPTQPNNIISSCNKYAKSEDSGDGCYNFAARNGIDLSQLYEWNAVFDDGNACSTNFWPGYYYCIGIMPSPVQPDNIVANCNKFAKSEDSGDGCYNFAARNGIELSQLYQWNKVFDNGDACGTKFWAGYYYCTGVSD